MTDPMRRGTTACGPNRPPVRRPDGVVHLLQVARRRLAADDDLDAAVPERLRASLEQRRAATLAGIQQLTGEGVRSVALRPDRTGRG
jgi:hypothetical protein